MAAPTLNILSMYRIQWHTLNLVETKETTGQTIEPKSELVAEVAV